MRTRAKVLKMTTIKHSKINGVKNNLLISQRGQALIESVIVFTLILSLLTCFFASLATATQIFLWHQKANQALLCSLNERQSKNCFKDFIINTSSNTKKLSSLNLTKFKFHKIKQRPLIEFEVTGFFNETYKIKKSLSKKNWQI